MASLAQGMSGKKELRLDFPLFHANTCEKSCIATSLEARSLAVIFIDIIQHDYNSDTAILVSRLILKPLLRYEYFTILKLSL